MKLLVLWLLNLLVNLVLSLQCVLSKMCIRDSSEEDLMENLNAFVSAILRVKPATVKGDYVKSISIASTMGLSLIHILLVQPLNKSI